MTKLGQPEKKCLKDVRAKFAIFQSKVSLVIQRSYGSFCQSLASSNLFLLCYKKFMKKLIRFQEAAIVVKYFGKPLVTW